MYITAAISVIFIAWIVVCLIQLVRLQLLSKAVRAAIDDAADKRQEIIDNGGTWEEVRTIPYPDIGQCYDSLKWYKPWERPSTLVTFEKEN